MPYQSTLPSLICGDPASTPLILLHGFMGAKEDFVEMMKPLSTRFYCMAIDLPKPLEREDYVERLQHYFQDRFSSAIIVGYSMGGRLALQLSHRYRSFYSHVCALSAHPGITSEQERMKRAERDMLWIEKLRRQTLPHFLMDWYDQPLFQSLHQKPDLMHQILNRRSHQDPEKLIAMLQHLNLAKLPYIVTHPPRSLFVCGIEDRFYKKLYRALPHQQVEDSGHVVHLENPKRCAEIILEWATP